jgi:hypothetical protein
VRSGPSPAESRLTWVALSGVRCLWQSTQPTANDWAAGTGQWDGAARSPALQREATRGPAARVYCEARTSRGPERSRTGVYDASLHAWRAYGAPWEASVDRPPVEPPPGAGLRLVQQTSARCYAFRPGHLRYARA